MTMLLGVKVKGYVLVAIWTACYRACEKLMQEMNISLLCLFSCPCIFFSLDVQKVCSLFWEKVAVRWKDRRDLALIVEVPRNACDLGQFGDGTQGCEVPCMEGLGLGHSTASCVPLHLGLAAQHQGVERFVLEVETPGSHPSSMGA